MGEYADMEIDRWIGEDDLNWMFGGGRRRDPPPRREVRCPCCNQGGLHYDAAGQRRDANNKTHVCPMPTPGRLSLDDLIDGT